MYITGSFAKEIDLYAIKELGIPSLSLMERAAEQVCRHAELAAERICGQADLSGKKRPEACRRPQDTAVLILCGAGNNGADGLAAGAMLLDKGFRNIRAFFCGDPERASEEFRFQRNRFEQAGGRLLSAEQYQAAETELILDALFGIGLHRPVAGLYGEMIREIRRLRQAGAYVIAVDIPSGVDADQGRNMCAPGLPVEADETVTFGWAKTGHFLGAGYGSCGRLQVYDIGYPPGIIEALLQRDLEAEGRRCREAGKANASEEQAAKDGGSIPGKVLLDTETVFRKHQREFQERRPAANKGDYGKLLIAAGSEGMAGAAYLAGLSAYRSGIGMVKYLGPEANRVILQTLLPEAMYQSYQPDRDPEGLAESLKWADILILGPGISRGPYGIMLVETVLREAAEERKRRREQGGHLWGVLDADALNILSERRELLQYLDEETVLTPHLGELARLTGRSIPELKENLWESAAALAQSLGTNILAKDCVSLLAGPEGNCLLNKSGSAALAKAGSGDVLTGVIAGCTGVLGDIFAGAAAGAFLHGRAGSLAGAEQGLHSILAREIGEHIGAAMRE